MFFYLYRCWTIFKRISFCSSDYPTFSMFQPLPGPVRVGYEGFYSSIWYPFSVILWYICTCQNQDCTVFFLVLKSYAAKTSPAEQMMCFVTGWFHLTKLIKKANFYHEIIYSVNDNFGGFIFVRWKMAEQTFTMK